MIDGVEKEVLERKVEPNMDIAIDSIDGNPFQPRSHFDEQSLEELAASIRQVGIVQPLTVRETAGGRYQLIAGERRLRAARLAGLSHVPAYIRTADDQAMLELALVENIQREDLNAMDVALSYQRLIEECSLTQEILSDRVGKKRPTITNYLRLLRLPPQIQIAVRNQEITMGHAKALINMEHPEQQMDLFARVVREGLSVRQTEELARTTAITGKSPEKSVSHVAVSPAGKACSESFSNWLQRPVELKPASKGKGRIVIPYFSDQDLRQLSQTIESLLRNS